GGHADRVAPDAVLLDGHEPRAVRLAMGAGGCAVRGCYRWLSRLGRSRLDCGCPWMPDAGACHAAFAVSADSPSAQAQRPYAGQTGWLSASRGTPCQMTTP